MCYKYAEDFPVEMFKRVFEAFSGEIFQDIFEAIWQRLFDEFSDNIERPKETKKKIC